MTDPRSDGAWQAPSTIAQQLAAGRAARRATPRRVLSDLTTSDRDPLGILDAQNTTRVPELVPLRIERMSASPFAFYRGTAALMAADLARDADSGIVVASCGDAQVANFGFYASPQRTLVFDLNDFDEAAWAPWEWDLKRLVTSVVIAGQATARDETTVRDAARATVRAYVRSLRLRSQRSPIERYYEHFDAEGGLAAQSSETRRIVRSAIRSAERRTTERATRKLTETDAAGRLRFVERPPTMTHVPSELEARVQWALDQYVDSANADIQLLVQQYTAADTARRVVGVGSVGTRCYVTVLQDGNGNALLLQTKEAGRSVLVEHGRQPQPPRLEQHIEQVGEGGRVVALQRILQAVSDPFLGYLRGMEADFYVRQFHDMKGGIDIETLDDVPFRRYAQACAVTLARAHGQSPHAATITGYVGSGRAVTEAVLEWAYAYADLSRADYEEFVAAQSPA